MVKFSKEATEWLVDVLKRLDLDAAQLQKLSDDLTDKEFAEAIAENPELVESWKELDKLGVYDAVRKNPEFLKQFDASSRKLYSTHTPSGAMKGIAIGHTYTKHGSHNTKTLIYQAKNGTTPQGQWLDDLAAEDLISKHLDQLGQGARDIPIPDNMKGIGRIFENGTGKILEPTHIRLVPSGSGVSTAYPINETIESLRPLGVYKP